MVKKRTGYPSLAYTGVRPRRSADILLTKNNPTPRTKEFLLGTFILNLNELNIFALVSKENREATWKEFDVAESAVQTLSGNTGDVVTPDALNINIVGGTGIGVTGENDNHSLTVDIDGTFASFFVTDNGTAEPEDSILNIFGGRSISTSGAGSTITVSVSGTTNHAVQTGATTDNLHSIGVGTTGHILRGNSNSFPLFDKVGAYSNIGRSLVLAQGNNAFTSRANYPPNGSTYIGNTGNDPSVNTITAGDGIQITNGPGTITVGAESVEPIDIESGTFTPFVTYRDTIIAPTYASQIGYYTRVKNLVYYYLFIHMLTPGQSGTNVPPTSGLRTYIDGFPFPGSGAASGVSLQGSIFLASDNESFRFSVGGPGGLVPTREIVVRMRNRISNLNSTDWDNNIKIFSNGVYGTTGF